MREGLSNPVCEIISYDLMRYGFVGWAERALRVPDLSRVHFREDLRSLPVFDAMALCRSNLSTACAQCKGALTAFFKEEILPRFGMKEGFQSPPMFRVHLDCCRTISAIHRDRDYGMPISRLTVWFPLTRVWGNNTLRVALDGKVLQPIQLEVGQALVFDSANLLHGSVCNNTGSTRISIDSRFTPEI